MNFVNNLHDKPFIVELANHYSTNELNQVIDYLAAPYDSLTTEQRCVALAKVPCFELLCEIVNSRVAQKFKTMTFTTVTTAWDTDYWTHTK